MSETDTNTDQSSDNGESVHASAQHIERSWCACERENVYMCVCVPVHVHTHIQTNTENAIEKSQLCPHTQHRVTKPCV